MSEDDCMDDDKADQPEYPVPDTRRDLTRLQFIRGAAAGAAGVVGLVGCRGGTTASDPDAADLAALRKVDPRLVIYREVGRIETGFAQARGVAVCPDGSVIVVGDAEARVFGAEGTRKSVVATGGSPACVAVAPDGTVVVGYTDHVELFDAKGARIAAWPSLGERARITAVAANDREVWVGDAGNRIAIGYDRTGRKIGRVGAKDAAAHYAGLVLPSPHLDVALTSDGHVIVNNPGEHRIETHSRDGKMLTSWGQESNEIEGFCGCCNPTDFAILPDGRFVTSEKGLPRVKLYNARGDFDGVVAAPDAFDDSVVGLDLAAGRDGRIYVLDPKTKTVRIFATKA
jgi:DNA-binding beta-propeller fold protein YncE